MTNARLWLAVVVGLPPLVIGVSLLRVDVERLRRLAVASAIVMLFAALSLAVSSRAWDFSIRSSALSWAPGGEAIVRIDTLSATSCPSRLGCGYSRSLSRRARHLIGAGCAARPWQHSSR